MKVYSWKKGDTIVAANKIEFYLKSDVVARDAKLREKEQERDVLLHSIEADLIKIKDKLVNARFENGKLLEAGEK